MVGAHQKLIDYFYCLMMGQRFSWLIANVNSVSVQFLANCPILRKGKPSPHSLVYHSNKQALQILSKRLKLLSRQLKKRRRLNTGQKAVVASTRKTELNLGNLRYFPEFR